MAKKSSMQMMAEAVSPTKSEAAVSPKKTDGVKATPPSRPAAEGTAKTGDAKPEGAPTEAAAAPAKGKDKKPEGPVKIETCQQLLKALWSSRGKVFIAVDSFPIPLVIEKSCMTDYLKNVATPTDPAPYDLVPRADNTGSDLVVRVQK